MAERCTLCSWVIEKDQEITCCPQCGSQYHSGCWSHLEKCYNCAVSISDKSGVEQKGDEVVHIIDEKETGLYSKKKETGMFSNIGEKLKSWARIITVLGIIIGIVMCVPFALIDEEMILIGALSGIIEAVVAWICSLILYAFGELVQNSKESKEIQQEILEELRNKKE